MLRRLREEAKKFDCTVCGTNHAHSDIRVLGKLDTSWIVRVTCSSCQTTFKLLVVEEGPKTAVTPVKEDRPRERRRPAMTFDDVLDAHDALEAFDGDVNALFKRGAAAKREPRRS